MPTQKCSKCNDEGKVHDSIDFHKPGCIRDKECKACDTLGFVI